VLVTSAHKASGWTWLEARYPKPRGRLPICGMPIIAQWDVHPAARYLKAVNQATGEVVASDRQTTVGMDLTEQIAAKNALQEAGAQLAERMLPKIVKESKDK